ncbi:spry domain containing socs box protein [Anaeramoeba flamelloides]|uniref:Spry domain containing socs box protein n=1 Tax=Anaeramoeba flamelloides TaxID=1746091 RepID=A0AAV7YP73_9EUKA|nr:spry domain containing socs box protein [Anaeramoeba flamelloides]
MTVNMPIEKIEPKVKEKQIYSEQINFQFLTREFELQLILTKDNLEIKLYDLNNEDVYQNKIKNENFSQIILNKTLKTIKLLPDNFLLYDQVAKHFLFIFGLKEINLKATGKKKNKDLINFKIEMPTKESQQLKKRIEILEKNQKTILQDFEQRLQEIANRLSKKQTGGLFKMGGKPVCQWDTSNAESVVFSENNLQVTAINGNFWRGVRGDKILAHGVTTIKIKMDKLHLGNGGIMVGVVDSKYKGINYNSTKGHMLYSSNGYYYQNGQPRRMLCKPLNQNDIVSVIVDMDRKELAFKLNDKTLGTACSDLPKKVLLAIDLYYQKCSASILF